MAFIVPLTVRFAVNQVMAGRNIVNIVDQRIDDSAFPGVRAASCEIAAEQLLGAWDANLRPFAVNNLSCQSVSWVDLHSSDGSTGTVNTHAAVTWPANGGSAGDPMTSQTAILVHKNTAGSARGQRRGRMYLAGSNDAANSDDSPHLVNTTLVTSLNLALGGFLAALNAPIGEVEGEMVVVHILTRGTPTVPGRLGPPLTGSTTPVSGLTTDAVFATQRRRLR